jgi:organic hydroperoxide reductase OsmC/OhrA
MRRRYGQILDRLSCRRKDADMEQQTYFYDTQIQWAKKRRGILQSQGLPDLKISTPPEFKGETGFWTPEHLFVGAAEACLMATFIGISENSHLAIGSYSSTARGKVEATAGSGLRFTDIKISPLVELENREDRPLAERIMAKAAQNCLVANSIFSRVQVEPVFVLKKVQTAA